MARHDARHAPGGRPQDPRSVKHAGYDEWTVAAVAAALAVLGIGVLIGALARSATILFVTLVIAGLLFLSPFLRGAMLASQRRRSIDQQWIHGKPPQPRRRLRRKRPVHAEAAHEPAPGGRRHAEDLEQETDRNR